MPNIEMLENALKQTGWKKKMPSKETWSEYILDVVHKADWHKVRKDVENFLENPSDFEVFSKENVEMLLERK